MNFVQRSVGTARVRGRANPDGVERFVGIRYATARRFERPALVHPIGDVDATNFGAACPQMPVLSPLVPGSALGAGHDEDCLFLNVWSPPGSGPYPVLVWIHGGSFMTGASSQAMFEMSTLAARGCVVVSCNYRLGPLGFLDVSHFQPDGSWVANAGLLDQCAALDWIAEHIAEFGGDPNRVTVIGESAGGGSILHLLDERSRRSLFHRGIVLSGSAGFTFAPEVAAMIADRFVAHLGAEGTAGAGALAGSSASSLIRAMGPTMTDPEVYSAAGMMPFHPCVDGNLVTRRPSESIDAGATAGCDIWFGTTRDEMALFVDAAPMEIEQVQKRVARYAGLAPEDATRLVTRYEATLAADGLPKAPRDVWAAIFSDREMALPIRAMAMSSARSNPNTFLSWFTWPCPPRPDGRPLGAAHATDLPFVFDAIDIDGWAEFLGAADEPRRSAAGATVRAMQDAVVSFTATGDPGWPSFGDDGATHEFGVEVGVRRDPVAARARLWDMS